MFLFQWGLRFVAGSRMGVDRLSVRTCKSSTCLLRLGSRVDMSTDIDYPLVIKVRIQNKIPKANNSWQHSKLEGKGL